MTGAEGELARWITREVYGIKSGGVDYAVTGGKVNDIKAQLDAYKRKIATGRIKVPTRPS